MGFNTACIILNDQLHQLARDPEAGRKVELNVLTASRADPDRQTSAPGFNALPSAHADTVQIVAVGGNRIFLLGYGHYTHEPEELLKQLADQMGFRIVRKKAPAPPALAEKA